MDVSPRSRSSLVWILTGSVLLALLLWTLTGPGVVTEPAQRVGEESLPRARGSAQATAWDPSTADPARGRIGAQARGTEPPARAEPDPPAASIAVRLADAQGRAPAWGGVLLWRDGERRDSGTRARATSSDPARFGGLEPGSYQVAIEPGSLAAGWVPAHPEGWSVDPSDPPTSKLELTAGGEREISLLVRASAQLFGTIYGPDGIPVPYATVRLHGTGRYVGRASSVDVDADEGGGYFVELTPGKYMVHAMPGPSGHHPLALGPAGLSPSQSPIHGMTKPLPRWQVLDAGESVRHDIHFGAGRAVIRGRVVDGNGEPVPGLRTLVYPHGEAVEGDGTPIHMGWAVSVRGVDTDPDGRFVLDGLEAARYGIQTGLMGAYTPKARPGANVLGDWPEPVYVRVGDGEEVDVGEIRVWRSRPFVARGRVVSLTGRHYAWETVQPSGWRRRTRESSYPLEVAADGSFSWHVETPEGPVRMRALAAGRVIHEETFHPEPDGEEWREIRVP